MEYIQAVLVQIAADRIDGASGPQGLLAELDEHRIFVQQQPGCQGMRVTRSVDPDGNVLVVVETRWQDESSLAQYGAHEPNATSIINEHQDLIVPGSLQVSDVEAPSAAPLRAPADAMERLTLPLLVPLGAFAFAVLVVYGLSRIYLAVPSGVSTPLALGVAVGILLTSWYLASNPSVPRWQVGSIVAVAVALLVGGGIFAAVQNGEEEGEMGLSPAPVASVGEPAPETAAALHISALGIAFDAGVLEAPAGEPFAFAFENQEGVPHNVAIYSDESATEPLFVGEIFSGPDSRTYQVPALEAGTYFFRCDVHPVTMIGKLVMTEGEGASPEETAPDTGESVGSP